MSSLFSFQRAFTLVELLVAMAVLSLLVLVMIQVVTLTEQALNISSKNLDAAGQARLVFDRLGADLAARPSRPDLGMVFTKTLTGSDYFRFYSEVASYGGVRGITAVGYRIQTTTPGRIYQLERGAVGTDWTSGSTGLQFLPQVFSPASPAASDNPDDDYEVLANGVFRLEFCYLLTSGKLTINPPPNYAGVAAIVVAIGVLDNKSLKLLSVPATQLSGLSDALTKTADGNDPLAAWDTTLTTGFAVTGVPKPIVQSVRVYERTFYVP